MALFKKDEDDFNLFVVELDIIGIRGSVFMEVPGNNIKEALELAMESIADLDAGDCSVESASIMCDLE